MGSVPGGVNRARRAPGGPIGGARERPEGHSVSPRGAFRPSPEPVLGGTKEVEAVAMPRWEGFVKCPGCGFDLATGEGVRSCSWGDCPYLPEDLNVYCDDCRFNLFTMEGNPSCDDPLDVRALEGAPRARREPAALAGLAGSGLNLSPGRRGPAPAPSAARAVGSAGCGPAGSP